MGNKERRRAALFLDFDNIIGGLIPLDLQAGQEFARNPSRWMSWLREPDEEGVERDFLVMKCYMNSQGHVKGPTPLPRASEIGETFDPESAPKPEKFYNSKWRSFFTKAGFEIVDCPPLSRQEKNGADIRICLDVMDSLSSRVIYDEYVIASGDSDFTPLFQRIRADDRQITLLTTNPTSSNLRAIATTTLGVEDLLPVLRLDTPYTISTDSSETADSAANSMENRVTSREDSTVLVRQNIINTLEASQEPLLLSNLGVLSRKWLAIYEGVRFDWFGFGTFKRYLLSLAIPDLVIAEHLVWLSNRHIAPDDYSHVEGFTQELEDLVILIDDLPKFNTAQWGRMLEIVREVASYEHFDINSCAGSVRDQMNAEGISARRSNLVFVLTGIVQHGGDLSSKPLPASDDLAVALVRSIVAFVRRFGFHATNSQRRALAAWIFPSLEDSRLGLDEE